MNEATQKRLQSDANKDSSHARAKRGMHEMHRRKFIQLTNKIVLGATGAALLPLPALPSRKVEYLEDISPNYRAWREALIQVMMSGNYKLRSVELERPIGGFRRARL